MEIGFSPREARLGLRACQGNVERAAEYIMKERQVKIFIKQYNLSIPTYQFL